MDRHLFGLMFIVCCSFMLFEQCSLLSVTFTDLPTSSPALGLGHPPAPAFIHGSEGFNWNVRGVRSRSFPAAARLSARTVSSVLLHLWSGGLERKREYWCIAVKCMRQDGRGWERRMGERGREGAGENRCASSIKAGRERKSRCCTFGSSDDLFLLLLRLQPFHLHLVNMETVRMLKAESRRLLCQKWPTVWILDFVNVI